MLPFEVEADLLMCLEFLHLHLYTGVSQTHDFFFNVFEFIKVMLTSQYELEGSSFSSVAGKNLYKPA